MKTLIKILQGSLIGLGAVLPGISGGVLCVIFGIYQTIMELLADPFRNLKTHGIRLLPYIIGGVLGFLGVANLLSIVLEGYPAPSVCLFVGLITGMLPALFQEAGKEGRNRTDFFSLEIAMIITFVILISIRYFSLSITPDFFWYLFCGFCLALSLIAPGMSFSTLLMPLDLYEPFVTGISHLDFSVLIPAGIGTFATIILLSRAVNHLFKKYYSMVFHGIIGIVITATIMIIPFPSFTVSFTSALVNTICILVGTVAAFYLDKFNKKYEI